MRRAVDVLLALAIPGLILLYLSAAPYTKIEESFTTQATHDILTFGIPWHQTQEFLRHHYDHLKYPELHPVPRTFVAPLALAAASWPFIGLVKGLDRQILVRSVLGLTNAFAIIAYRNALRNAFGRSTANWFAVLQASQFHVLFYASRLLPNFIPFGLNLLAMQSYLPTSSIATKIGDRSPTVMQGLAFLTVLGIVFRSELAILLASHTLYLLLIGVLHFRDMARAACIGVPIGLFLTVAVDSVFWTEFPSWPEFTSFYFNAIQGKSSDWGTSPFTFYFSSALPKLFLNPVTYLLCIPIAVLTPALRRSSLDLLIPHIAYILIYSLQPHKEWRFIVYSIPPLTAVAARGAAYIWDRRAKAALYSALSLILVGSVILSLMYSALSVAVSALNYPGAAALNRLHQIHQERCLEDQKACPTSVRVHVDVLTAQTGATLFLQHRNATTQWLYDKTDVKSGDGLAVLRPDFWASFDYALAEEPQRVIGKWDVLDTVYGYSGLKVIRPGDAWSPEQEFDQGQKQGLPVSAWLPFQPRAGSTPYGEGPWASFGRRFRQLWVRSGMLARRHLTRGWWMDVRMEPMIRILRRADA